MTTPPSSPKITVHHLTASRSFRLLFLLETLNLPYTLIIHSPIQGFAPSTSTALHPLGKFPLLELDGKMLAESGFIVETLIARYGGTVLGALRGGNTDDSGDRPGSWSAAWAATSAGREASRR